MLKVLNGSGKSSIEKSEAFAKCLRSRDTI